MKNIFFIFLFSTTITLFAQTNEGKENYNTNNAQTATKALDKNDPYVKGMKTGIQIMDKAMNVGQLEQAANFFMDMADQRPTDWLPPYYAAYCYTLMSFMEKQKLLKDKYLDDAQLAIEQAQKIADKNSEILVVQAYIYQMRLEVNPLERMEEYGTMANLTLENAEKLNPDNPRIYYIRAQNMFFAPDASRQDACEVVSTAQAKYVTFEPENELSPKWGVAMTDFMAYKCQELYWKKNPDTNTSPIKNTDQTTPNNTNEKENYKEEKEK
jgi:tetratricopeptide (TPR) repeat protein